MHLCTLTLGGWEESTTKLSEDEFTIQKEKKNVLYFCVEGKKDKKPPRAKLYKHAADQSTKQRTKAVRYLM